MTRTAPLIAAALTIGLIAPAFAQSTPPAVSARQGQMNLMALNIGVIAGMARGTADYDADMAQIAANNLVTLAALDQSFTWPEGTDNFLIEGSRALPEIWTDPEGFAADYGDFAAAAEAIAAAAGGGLDALRGAIGPLGGSCGACHDDYREPN